MIDEGKPILVLEDDEMDTRTVRRAVKELHLTNPLVCVGNGEEGLAWLQTRGHGLPSLILLDLNMPRMNGIEFLQAVKSHPCLRQVPVVVLTTSRLEQDKLASFERSVAGYMVKPVDYTQFVEIIRAIDVYWTLSEMP